MQQKNDAKLNLLVLDARNDKRKGSRSLTKLHWCWGWQRGTDKTSKKGEEKRADDEAAKWVSAKPTTSSIFQLLGSNRSRFICSE